MQTQVLESYINTFTVFNEMPPQLEAFIKGLKALNDNTVRICKFTFNDMFHTILVPEAYFKGVNTSTKCRQWLVNGLVKRDIMSVSVADFNNIIRQLFGNNTSSYISTYQFLKAGYNDKCRHTVIKYYSLDNPKK